MAMDAGVINAFCPDLIAIHKPAVNKWVRASDKNMEYLIIECGVPYAIKRKMYPIICTPLTLLAYKQRCKSICSKRKVLENNFQILFPILCRCVIGWRVSNLVHL